MPALNTLLEKGVSKEDNVVSTSIESRRIGIVHTIIVEELPKVRLRS